MRPVIVTDSMVIRDLRLRILPNAAPLSQGGGVEKGAAAGKRQGERDDEGNGLEAVR